MTQIAIILINWNQAAITIRCIQSIEEHTVADHTFSYEIVIVDNNSERASVDMLESFLQEQQRTFTVPHHFIKNEQNQGYAGGMNVGIKYAQQHLSPDYFWILNNDIQVQTAALNKLAAGAIGHPDVKIWGSTIYELHPRPHFHCAGGFRYNAFLSIPSPIRFPSGEPVPSGNYYSLPRMDYPAGAAMFIKADCFEKYGLLEEDYFLYYEELDYVQQIGGKQHLAWCPDSILHHQSGSSTGSQNPNQGKGSWIGHYYGNLSALKFTWKYYPQYFPVVFLFRLFSKAFLFTVHRDFSSFTPLFKAYKDFFQWVANRSKAKKK